MTQPTGSMFPPDAFEKSAKAAETRDYYAGLSDDEREEEGLPGKEAPGKEEPGPVEKPDAEAEGDEDDEDEDDEGEGSGKTDGRDATALLFDEIAGLRSDLSAALGERESAPESEAEDELLSAALEHDDPVIRGLAERLQNAERRLGAREQEAQAERVNQQLAKDDADFDAVRTEYAIGGKPLTKSQLREVEVYIVENPEIGSRLSIEQITRIVHPDAVRVGRRPSGKSGGPKGEEGPAAATIIDEGSSGGTPAGPWKPRPGETMESAIEAAGRAFGWKR